MDHHDHVNLLKKGIPQSGGIWADFGSGQGAFTLALAELIGPNGTIYSVDKDNGALRRQEQAAKNRFPGLAAYYIKADFTKPLDLPPIDGLVIANALHFLQNKDETIQLLANYLRPGGRFLVVEYNTDRGNHWVPHPFSFKTWESLAQRNGLEHTRLLATRPSRFLGEIYSAISLRPE